MPYETKPKRGHPAPKPERLDLDSVTPVKEEPMRVMPIYMHVQIGAVTLGDGSEPAIVAAFRNIANNVVEGVGAFVKTSYSFESNGEKFTVTVEVSD